MEKRIIMHTRKNSDGSVSTYTCVRTCYSEEEKRRKRENRNFEKRVQYAMEHNTDGSWLPKANMSNIMDAFDELMDSLEF